MDATADDGAANYPQLFRQMIMRSTEAALAAVDPQADVLEDDEPLGLPPPPAAICRAGQGFCDKPSAECGLASSTVPHTVTARMAASRVSHRRHTVFVVLAVTICLLSVEEGSSA